MDVGFPLVGKAQEVAIVSLLNPFISFVFKITPCIQCSRLGTVADGDRQLVFTASILSGFFTVVSRIRTRGTLQQINSTTKIISPHG